MRWWRRRRGGHAVVRAAMLSAPGGDSRCHVSDVPPEPKKCKKSRIGRVRRHGHSVESSIVVVGVVMMMMMVHSLV